MGKPLDEVLDVTVDGILQNVDAVLFLVLWLLLGKLGKYWRGSFFLST